MHTSASLTINENASPDVPLDLAGTSITDTHNLSRIILLTVIDSRFGFADSLDRLVPEGTKIKYRHDDEGPDDMPAHVKSSLMGPSLTIPVSKGKLALGTWQGIYLNEHRDYGGARRLVVTIQGQKRGDGRSYGSFQ
jgi:thiamine phosphate synthase YjbQ (UPF0047 family)